MTIKLDNRLVPTKGKIKITVLNDNGDVLDNIKYTITFIPLLDVDNLKLKNYIEKPLSFEGTGEYEFDGYNYLHFIGTYQIQVVDLDTATVGYATFDTVSSKESLTEVVKRLEWNFAREDISDDVIRIIYNSFVNKLSENAIIQTKPVIIEGIQNSYKQTEFELPIDFWLERGVRIVDQNERLQIFADSRNEYAYLTNKLDTYRQPTYHINKPNNKLVINSMGTNFKKIMLDYYVKPYIINEQLPEILMSNIEFAWEGQGVSLFEYYFAWRYYLRLEKFSEAKYYEEKYLVEESIFIESINSEAMNRVLANRPSRAWR